MAIRTFDFSNADDKWAASAVYDETQNTTQDALNVTTAKLNALKTAENEGKFLKLANWEIVAADIDVEAVDQAQAMIAPEETGTTASAPHAVGEYFRLGGVLYITTAAIAAGDTITPGTNCTQAVLGNDVSALKSALCTKIYPSFSILTVSINASTGKLNQNSKCRTVYFECEPDTAYTIKKTGGDRFAVGYSEIQPAVNRVLDYFEYHNEAGEISIVTDSMAKYVTAFVYFEDSDLPLTALDVLKSVEVYTDTVKISAYKRSFSTDYTGNTVYDSNIYLVNRYPKTATSMSAQALFYDDGVITIFGTNGAIRQFNRYGIPEVKTFADFDHPQYVEKAPDGHMLLTVTFSDESRRVCFYDFDTNSVLDSFVPAVDGNLLAASAIDSDNYYLIAWKNSSKNLYFYEYKRSTNTAAELGAYTLDVNYYQGGCRVGNLWYMMVNNGSGAQKSKVLVLNIDNMQVMNTIYVTGFKEPEGFQLIAEGDSVFAMFVTNAGGIYTIKMR